YQQIPAYNGGLFAADKILDKLVISDEVLHDNLLRLANYDFNTELDVNILGHIFEHSLNELEEMEAKIAGNSIGKNSKRKKDGIFYTPKYITQYIVENTLGKLCVEKRQELGLIDVEFDNSFYRKDGKLSVKGNKLFKNLEKYKKWLLTLKILDPACGSGAFLNQTLIFLMAEHKFISDLLANLTETPLELNIDKIILEKNIFGVDINEESVEIAQLSLWLRTAKKGRKLSNLSGNIKCGNSLINDVAVAGEKAFNWDEEFAVIMRKGGFDVVIGNPPYFNIETLGAKSPIAQAIQNSYPEIWQDKSDIIFYFIAKSIELTKNKIGFIVSNAFLFSNKAEKLRNYILENVSIEKIINFEQFMVFKDASITTSIIELSKNNMNTLAYSFKAKNYTEEDISKIINNVNNYFEVKLQKDSVFALVDKKIAMLNDKIDADYLKLNQICEIGQGMQTAADKIFSFREFPNQFPKEFIKNRVTGKNIERYFIDQTGDYLLYFEDIESFEKLPLSIQNHLLENRTFLENRADKKRRKTSKWWNYTFPIHKDYYYLDKIFCSRRAFNNTFVIDSNNEYLAFSNMTVIFDTNENFDIKYLLALLNSTTLNFRYKSIGKQTGGGSFEYFPNGVGKLPIPQISQERQQPFIDLVDNILATKQQIKDYQSLLNDAVKNDNFDREIKLKQAIYNFESKVIQIDKEIDKMVYELYGLTAEEIEIVEGDC
ncbi:N-6 DNA methylase, partial [Candidatus Halobeggiatoa sp. HSG11]|nr:N-6 DNA methylase [Candidatus Halobeggiatoa sp. HSG11]